MDDSYRFDIYDNRVTAYSTFRLPFEAKGLRQTFKNELREHVRRLQCPKDHWMIGTYASADRTPVDLDNIACYYLETSTLHHLCERGLVLERAPAVDLPEPHSHALVFLVASVTCPPAVWKPARRLASWSFACTRLRGDLKPESFWFPCRSEEAQIHSDGAPIGPLGIELTLFPKRDERVLPANVIKPLLDGVLCAFHGHDGSNLKELALRIARRMGRGATADDVRRFLSVNPRNILGTRCLVRPYRNGVQWYPADDRVQQIVLRIGEPDIVARCVGQLYSVSV